MTQHCKPQQELTAIKQSLAMEVPFSTSDNTPHHNPKSRVAKAFGTFENCEL